MRGSKRRAAERAHAAGGAALLLSFLAAVPAAAQPEQSLYRFADPAPWVDVTAPQYETPDATAHSEQGAWFLLFDRQINVTDKGDDFYQHLAVDITDAAGVADFSQFNVPVDPTFQSLVFHRLQVVRGGDVIDQRRIARVTALPQETELSQRVYNGRYNVNVLLSDVRAGDVVELSYTVRSTEQLFPGHFSTRLSTAWSLPLHRQLIRIRWPAARTLRYRMTDGSPAPEPHVRGSSREVVMEWTDLDPVAIEAETPSWYEPWPYLEISDLESWNDVSRLVHPLFAARRRASAGVAAVASGIASRGGPPLDQALHALQYVQEQIRYTSIAIGRGSFEPADPDTVLERRFGDCKDKSLLLASLLNRLGIEAEPALVHSLRGHALPAELPTPYAFDHAIVRARIDGNVYWLDATTATRYSPLSSVEPADFEHALPVDGSSGLEAIPRPAPAASRQYNATVFDLRDAESATLAITTRYLGPLADAARPVLARGTGEQRRSDYATYITRYYPSAKSSGPITIDDDKKRNVVEVRENYGLAHAFDKNEDGELSFVLYADELYPYAEALGIGSRKAPLAIGYPVHMHQRLIARLPHEWSVQPETWQVDDPAFRFRGQVAYSDRTLQIDYEYESLADHVEPADLEQYQADRSHVLDSLAYVLTDRAGASSDSLALAPSPLIAILLSLGLGVWAAVRWGYRYDPAPKTVPEGAPAGIAGWLILPAIGAVAGPFVWLWTLSAWAPFVEAAMWHRLPAIVNEAHRSWAQPMLLGILAVTVLLLIGTVLFSVLFFKKRTSAPVAFIALTWLALAFAITVLAWTAAMGLDQKTNAAVATGESIRDVIVSLVWTLYMLSSKRVKATFVKRLHEPGTDSAGAVAAAS